MSEPVITINGVELSFAQSMMVRLVLLQFETDTQRPEVVAAGLWRGEEMRRGLATVRSVIALMRLS